jgi:hypothetical protein
MGWFFLVLRVPYMRAENPEFKPPKNLPLLKPGMVLHICDCSTQEAEAG